LPAPLCGSLLILLSFAGNPRKPQIITPRIGERSVMSSQQIEPGSPEPFLTQREIAKFVREATGIPIGDSTILKLCSPAIGGGPQPSTYFGRRPLYAPSEVLRWAKASLSPKPRPTAHPTLPPKPKRENDDKARRKRRHP
jgi:hypothetical protein